MRRRGVIDGDFVIRRRGTNARLKGIGGGGVVRVPLGLDGKGETEEQCLNGAAKALISTSPTERSGKGGKGRSIGVIGGGGNRSMTEVERERDRVG